MPRRRHLRFVRLGGTVACLAVALAWLASLRWGFMVCLLSESRPEPVDGIPCLFLGGGVVFQADVIPSTSRLPRLAITSLSFRDSLREAFVWPEFSALSGIVIPLWLPLIGVGVPTALLWWIEHRRIQILAEALDSYFVRRRFLPWPLCAIGAVPVFIAILFAIPPALDWAFNLVAGDDFHLIMRTRLGAPEMLADGIFLFLIIAPAFLTAQFVYRRLHWRNVRVPATPHCRTCGYLLIGNVSGICPECGTPITPISPADTSRSSG